MTIVKIVVNFSKGGAPQWGTFDTLKAAKKAVKDVIDEIYSGHGVSIEKFDGSKYYTAYDITVDGIDKKKFLASIHDFDKKPTNRLEQGNYYAISF